MQHLEIPESPNNPYRLGRHVLHDSRSLAFALPALPIASLKSIRWERRIPVLNQGDLGQCTACSAVGWLGTDNARRKGFKAISRKILDERYAEDFYHEETQIDDFGGVWPPDDTGSNGLAIGKVLKARGLVSSYSHAFGLRAALSALQNGPILLGLPWHKASFEPSKKGNIRIRGSVVGGHEVIADEIDVKNRRVWITNSWGDWGVAGRGYFTWNALEKLLSDDGDVTVPLT